MILSLDTETTGLDLRHGARPYYTTTCDEQGEHFDIEWPVDPLTRAVEVDTSDIGKVQRLLDAAESVVLQNGKFDCGMLEAVGVRFPWSKVEDTLIAGHVLASKLQHDLTSMADQYLGRDIKPYEDRLEKAVQTARRYARSHVKEWLIAKAGVPCMPSAKEKTWKFDTWLPKTLLGHVGTTELFEHYGEDVSWWATVLQKYARVDSSVTLLLWQVMEKELKKRNLWKIYREKLKVVSALYRMERRGVTVNRSVLRAAKREYQGESLRLGKVCVGIAESLGYALTLPEGGRNGSLDSFVFDHMKLPVLDYTEGGRPALTAEIKERYEHELPANTLPQKFVSRLNQKAEYDTAVNYLENYERFYLPVEEWVDDADPQKATAEVMGCSVSKTWARLHPNLNPTGTATTRLSCNYPNTQNISKQARVNLRKCFGPAPGRVWYSFDAQNIELRIPAYKAGERELIEVFDHPDRGPYYGSYHLVVFDTLHPDLFKQYGKDVKVLFEDTHYQWVKNGNFARQYGGQPKKVDRTFHVPGASKLIGSRFPSIDRLSREACAFATRHGLVYTVPDSLVDPKQGYPLMTRRSEWEEQSPTIPFCYFVSGTAGWWLNAAMIACDSLLESWRGDGFDGHTILTVHDELVFDFPIDDSNSERVVSLKSTMEACGDRIGVPTPVSVERHDESWAVGVAV